jgi:ABC-type ATPase involved in cell division
MSLLSDMNEYESISSSFPSPERQICIVYADCPALLDLTYLNGIIFPLKDVAYASVGFHRAICAVLHNLLHY